MNPVSNPGVVVPLLLSAKPGYLACIQILIDAKVPLDQQDGTGRTALHLSSWFDHSNVVSLLISSGANKEVTDFAGHTPLHLACWFGHIETAKILLNAGANINALDQVGRTPLHFACQHNRPNIVQLLLEKGANTKLKDVNGKTPEAVATEYSCVEIVELLQKHNKTATDKEQPPDPVPDEELKTELIRMKNLILKLGSERDSQSDKISVVKDKIEGLSASIQSLQANNFELENQIQMLTSQIQVLYNHIYYINSPPITASLSSISTPNLNNSLNNQPNNQPNKSISTSSLIINNNKIIKNSNNNPNNNNNLNNNNNNNLNTINSDGAIDLNSTKGSKNASLSVFSNSTSPMLNINTSQGSSHKSSKTLCDICKTNLPVLRCKVCHSPFCKDCSLQVQEKGCPFCQKNNQQKSWLNI